MTTNTEHLVSYLKAMDAHDLDSVRNAYADDVAIRAPGTELDGRDAAAAWMDAFVRAFPDLRHEILSTAETDETVALGADSPPPTPDHWPHLTETSHPPARRSI